MSDSVSKSWFCVFNNPVEYGYSGEPHEIAEKIADEWCCDCPTRTCAVAFCVSADGLNHCHAVFEDSKAMRFSVLKKAFPHMHIEPTKGNKEQAEDYIQKKGRFEEKGEVVLYIARRGEIKASQGARRDLEIIDDLILQGKTPDEIMSISLSYRRYEKLIRDAFYYKRKMETPMIRDVVVRWHVGESGTGKSYTLINLIEKYGESQVYFLTDYEHGFDKYCAEPFLFMDEFKGQIRFATLLNILDVYKCQIPCRYTNVFALWTHVDITSVFPPEKVYQNMVSVNSDLDTIQQLFRRITSVVYHWKDDFGYYEFELPMSEYKDYADLKRLAHTQKPISVSVVKQVTIDGIEIPF